LASGRAVCGIFGPAPPWRERAAATLSGVIVVIGSPVLRGSGTSNGEVAGLAGQVALAVAAAGRAVQVVGKVGDDDAGDALMVALTRDGIGHAALLRDAAHPTAVLAATAPDREADLDDAFAPDDADGSPGFDAPEGLPLEAADIELALRYLTAFQVLVIAAPLDAGSLHTALDSAGFSGAHVIRLDVSRSAGGEAAATEAPPVGVEVTAFEAPQHDEPAFAVMVGRYAAGLDAGRAPGDAFAEATRGTHWERAAAG
jgi:hypothetical protein